jgi:hypothetical protein
MTDPLTLLMLKTVWAGMLAGVLSGAIIGLFFAREDFMGGYQSWRRRLTRLECSEWLPLRSTCLSGTVNGVPMRAGLRMTE